MAKVYQRLLFSGLILGAGALSGCSDSQDIQEPRPSSSSFNDHSSGTWTQSFVLPNEFSRSTRNFESTQYSRRLARNVREAHRLYDPSLDNMSADDLNLKFWPEDVNYRWVLYGAYLEEYFARIFEENTRLDELVEAFYSRQQQMSENSLDELARRFYQHPVAKEFHDTLDLSQTTEAALKVLNLEDMSFDDRQALNNLLLSEPYQEDIRYIYSTSFLILALDGADGMAQYERNKDRVLNVYIKALQSIKPDILKDRDLQANSAVPLSGALPHRD